MVSIENLNRPRRVKDITGQRFGRLVAIRCLGTRPKDGAVWEFACDCGRTTATCLKYIRCGWTVSCGCRRQEQVDSIGPRSLKHGASKTHLYSIYLQIIDRCYRPENHAYADYGGRGIYVCERWRNDFIAFRDDMGQRPSMAHSVDRRDNNGPYSPSNCYWADYGQQARNTRRFCGKCRVLLQQKPFGSMTDEELESEARRLDVEESELRHRQTDVKAELARRLWARKAAS